MSDQIDPITDGIAVDSMRHRMTVFRERHPEFDCSADMAESLVFPNSSLKRHLRNKKDSAVGSGEKESGRSLAWVIRWQERKANRKARKLSRRAEGKIGKADRIVSYEKQKIHNPDDELRFIEDAERAYRAQLNFMRLISGIQCVPDVMRITEDDLEDRESFPVSLSLSLSQGKTVFIVSDNGKRPVAFGDISYAIMNMKEHLRESGLILSLELRIDREPTYVTLEDIYHPSDDVLSSTPYHNGAARVESGRPLHEADTLNYPERRKAYWTGVFRTMLKLD